MFDLVVPNWYSLIKLRSSSLDKGRIDPRLLGHSPNLANGIRAAKWPDREDNKPNKLENDLENGASDTRRIMREGCRGPMLRWQT